MHRISSDIEEPYFVGGRMHRLCLLPAIDELKVSEKELALSKHFHVHSDVDISALGDTIPSYR